MNTPVSPRPLSLLPFLATDVVLLLTASLVAWRTPAELSGGALLAVIICVTLGAVLAVVPFLVNDARERDATLAERQRQLVELVNTTTATATRWGTQWAAAATGLEDAASLAARSLATAERLPDVFQEKADALAERLDQALTHEQARSTATAGQDAVIAEQTTRLAAASSAVENALTGFGRLEAGLREQHAALATTLAGFPAAAARAQSAREALDERLAAAPAQIDARLAAARSALDQQAAQLNATAAGATHALGQTLAGFGHVESDLREQHASLVAVLAEFPAAATRAQAAREALDQRLATAPAHVDAQVARLTTEAEQRLTSTTAALTTRLAELEIALVSVTAQLDRVKAWEFSGLLPASAPVMAPANAIAPVPAAEVASVKDFTALKPPAAASPVGQTVKTAAGPEAAEPVDALATPGSSMDVVSVEPSKPASAPAPKPERETPKLESIMDPFYVPADGYSALADAMDLKHS